MLDIVCTEFYEYSGTFTRYEGVYFIRQGGKYEELTFVVLKNSNNEWQNRLYEWVGQRYLMVKYALGKRYMERTKRMVSIKRA